MPAPRSLATTLTVASSMLGLLFACSGGRSTNFPDRDGVVAAQSEWCTALAKLQRAGNSWEHLAACKAAFPTAAPAYLRAMTKCFSRRTEAAGDGAPDRAQIIQDCNDEIAAGAGAEDPAGQALVEARCARMARCENIAANECKAAFAKLETAQRFLFTTIYNAAGRQEIKDCLDTASCTDNEEAGRQACYKPVSDDLLWFPN